MLNEYIFTSIGSDELIGDQRGHICYLVDGHRCIGFVGILNSIISAHPFNLKHSSDIFQMCRFILMCRSWLPSLLRVTQNALHARTAWLENVELENSRI